MDWEELKQNPLLWIVGVLVLVTTVGFFSINVVIDKATDAVIEKLQKEYSPGPYAPGFDPDKVNPNFWNHQAPPNNSQPPSNQQPGPWRPPTKTVSGDWRTDWENQRR